MSRTMRTKIQRLRAMSVPEIAHRLKQFFYDKIDHARHQLFGAETPEQFLDRHRITSTKILLSEFRQRSIFTWQNIPADELHNLISEHFAQYRQATLSAADEFVQYRFRIFDKTVDFGSKIDWHYDPTKDHSVPLVWWNRVQYYNPDMVGEVKYVWELNRHQHFVTLAKAYFLTNDEKYARILFCQWEQWLEDNPLKYGINWTSSLECAFRLISWTWALQFAKQSSLLTEELFSRILQSVAQHADFIGHHLSLYSSANNHLIGEGAGLIYAGCYFPELKKSAVWCEKGFHIVFQEMLNQVHSDGVTKEQTTWYQKYVFDLGVLTKCAADFVGRKIPEQLTDRLERMAGFVDAVIDSSGNVPAIGDDDGGEALKLTDAQRNRYHEMLGVAAVLFDRGEFKKTQTPPEALIWLLGDAGLKKYNSLDRKSVAKSLNVFQQGGYAIVRTVQPVEQVFVFDAGPIGLSTMAAHGHADALSFTLSVGGQKIFIDSGTYGYTGAGEERNYFRGTKAHNTLSIDNKNQADILGPFQWGRKPGTSLDQASYENGTMILRGHHNGYARTAGTHHRTITFDNRLTWTINDKMNGKGVHHIDVCFHLAPCDLKDEDHKLLAHFENLHVELAFSCEQLFSVHIEEKDHSDFFGAKFGHPVVRIHSFVELPFEFSTTIQLKPI